MAWMICGSVPDADFSLHEGVWELSPDCLHLCCEERTVSVQRGTPALIGTAVLACRTLKCAPPAGLLVGDTGTGEGSRKLYAHLAAHVSDTSPTGLTFHYLFPDVDGHNRVLMALEELPSRPVLVADAGFMYVAKMSGYADSYDLFTPDVGEMAFLADEKAPHPFYTRGFLLAKEDNIPDLLARAYAHGNCSRHLLVKGSTDFIVAGGQIVGSVSQPQIRTMEPIGGTGDLVTGLVTALLTAGYPMIQACTLAAQTGRQIGLLARPTPATQVAELLPFLPEALQQALRGC